MIYIYDISIIGIKIFSRRHQWIDSYNNVREMVPLKSINRVLCALRDEYLTWWRHQMETFSALLAICAGNSPVTGEFPLKGQWRRALMFSLICAWINGWVNNREAGDLRCQRVHYDVIVMVRKRPRCYFLWYNDVVAQSWYLPQNVTREYWSPTAQYLLLSV